MTNLLVVEILLAALALKRGWRVAPGVLLAVPFMARASEVTLAGLFAPWFGTYFEPEATVLALAHAAALLGLIVASWVSPAELPVAALRLRATRRRSGPLYQI